MTTGFKDEVLTHYMDEEGLVTIDRDPTRWSTGNGLLFTGIFYTILAQKKQITPDDRLRFIQAVKRCEVPGFSGLFNRNKGRSDLQAHDDYIGVAAASFFINAPFAEDIVEYGEQNCWAFNNVNPGKFTLQTFHGRFPGLVPFYVMCTKQSPSFFQKLFFNSAVRGNADSLKTEVSGKILMWLQTRVALARNITPQACDLWNTELLKDYGSVNNMFKAYFGGSHPFSRAF